LLMPCLRTHCNPDHIASLRNIGLRHHHNSSPIAGSGAHS
jgi:hypothetical protein